MVNEYKLIVVVETNEHTYIRLYINNVLTNSEGLIRLKHKELDQLFKDLFKSSRGKCVKAYAINT